MGGRTETAARVAKRLMPGALLALVASGCVPDLSPWRIEGTGRADGSAPPAGQCDPPVTCPGACALPWLLASVEDLDGECGGRVWRWSLTGEDSDFCACSALDAGGQLPDLPFAVGVAPPSTVVIAAESASIVAIDGRNDTVLWESPNYPWQPADVFAIEDLTGRAMIAVAGRMRGGRDIRQIDFFDAAIGGEPISRQTNASEGGLPLGLGVSSVTQSPFDRRWLRAVKSGTYAAADVDPWNDVRFEDPLHTVDRESFYLDSIHASYDGVFHRTVWTGERTDLPDRPSGVYRIARSDDPGDNRVPLSESCDRFLDGRDYDVTCEYLHAVADPVLNTGSIALCQHASGERRIVRLGLIGDCVTVVEQSDVYEGGRISRLALAQDSFWAP